MGIFSSDEREEQFIEKTFEQELTSLINRHSIENLCGIPDFILAEMITGFIKSMNDPLMKTLKWYGFDLEKHSTIKEKDHEFTQRGD